MGLRGSGLRWWRRWRGHVSAWLGLRADGVGCGCEVGAEGEEEGWWEVGGCEGGRVGERAGEGAEEEGCRHFGALLFGVNVRDGRLRGFVW